MVGQFDIILVDLNPTTGNEKGKTRPCLIVSNTNFTKITRFAWVLPITNRSVKFPTDIQLVTTHHAVEGVIDCAQIRTLDLNARHYKKVDTLDESVSQSVKEVVLALVGSEL